MSCFVVCELWQRLWSFISFSFTNNNDFWHKDLHFKKKNQKEHNLEQEKGRGNWKIYSVIGYYLLEKKKYKKQQQYHNTLALVQIRAHIINALQTPLWQCSAIFKKKGVVCV